jgi:cytochrome P460
VRRTLPVVALCAALAAVAVVVASAETSANGLPSYTTAYLGWQKLNRKPITGGSAAHSGTKNVYASRPKSGRRYPNGAVIVKTIARPGDRKGRPSQVAVMRKANGRWRFVEYELSGSRYTVLAQGQLCVSCHVQAKSSDYVFTKR